MSAILEDLRARGLLAQTTDIDALSEALAAGPVTFYTGFDPTAASLHVGHLMQVLTMRRFQDAGHKPLALVGGATGLIGDPKPTAERMLNDPSVVAGWVGHIRGQIERFLDFEGPHAATMVNNLDWTSQLSAIDLLRDLGKHFSVNRMLDKEAVSARLATGISYTEFSYQILQANDYLELYRRHGCTLQLGGSDQWGNITAGADLIRRVAGGHAHALTTNLLLKSDGTKFGKTEGGAVWLDPALTSPYAFYQFWLNSDDRDVPTLLRYLSFRPLDEIEALESDSRERPAARIGQRALAEELTTLVHGAGECAAVVAASKALFGQGELAGLDEGTLRSALAELPRAKASRPLPAVVDLLADSGLCKSRSEARRAVQEGGAYVNNARVTDVEATLGEDDLLHGRWAVLRRGKRSLAAVEVG
ncbi:tyrosine--tRNA ligase [Motilibacter deserti]|uniref:Tyrosine--tRNA ligase n=1 Tax=Motilibacter deserti TaxID=2714956 RepID=A0ABX0GWJ5_9ACTN|nr:tyrosine--tRNA ligase [Motilibacter deserti]NHC14071.1 tyrosine--tRNA ligase [Motilibacter deserti]